MENINVTEQSTNEIMPMAASGETNFASLPEKATPASGDMFLMEDSEDTKKINYDKLADAILNKLTSKTYSGLETTAKNFVTAINELNSKSIKVAALTTRDNLGTWLGNNQILSGEKMCVLALNDAQNNPLGQCYAIIIHSVGYWSKHPQYIKLSGNTITTGVLDCTDTANITIHA